MQSFDIDVILRALPFLGEGMLLSLELTGLALCGGMLIGTALALMRLSPFRPLSLVAATYVNLLRSIPLILVIFWFYFLVPLVLGQAVGGFQSALVAFVMFEAAYYCEIIRAGIQSVPRGQTLAAAALGLTYRQTMMEVVLPQAFRNMVPVLLTQGIVLFQDTSLVYVVALRDFMTSSAVVATRDGRLLEMYMFAAVVYLAFCLSGSLLVKALRKRTVR